MVCVHNLVIDSNQAWPGRRHELAREETEILRDQNLDF
jgi:hypothetical protein